MGVEVGGGGGGGTNYAIQFVTGMFVGSEQIRNPVYLALKKYSLAMHLHDQLWEFYKHSGYYAPLSLN